MQKVNGKYEISVYSGKLTPKITAETMKRLSFSFPELTPEFYDVLSDRAIELKFSDKRLLDAVNNVIDNCVYPRPTIANFISWDKKINLLTWDQFVEKNNELGQGANKHYKSVRIEGLTKPLYAHINDIETYNLELWNKE